MIKQIADQCLIFEALTQPLTSRDKGTSHVVHELVKVPYRQLTQPSGSSLHKVSRASQMACLQTW